MHVWHEFVKTMDVPLDRFQFERDPLALNAEPRSEGVRVRMPPKQVAVSQDSGLPIAPVITITATPITENPVLITAFDVHGGGMPNAGDTPMPPRAPSSEPPRERTWLTVSDLAADYDVPSVVLYVVLGLSYVFFGAAEVLRQSVRLIRWSRRPRLKVVRADAA